MSNKVDSELRAVVAVLGAHGDVPFSGRDRGSVVRLNRQNLGHELVLATRGHLLLSHHAGERILEVCLGVLFDHGPLVLHASSLCHLSSWHLGFFDIFAVIFYEFAFCSADFSYFFKLAKLRRVFKALG